MGHMPTHVTFRIEKVLTQLSSGELVLDMKRLDTVINLQILDSLDKVRAFSVNDQLVFFILPQFFLKQKA